jgi:thiopeptide-type bacteriocin biosynthesis protein
LKLYCGESLHDDLIAGTLRSFCEQVVSEGMASRWFFLRYADPDSHLRIRFNGDPDILTGRLMPAVCRWASGLLAERSSQRVVLDTYDREVERYGGLDGVAVAERIFHLDSVAVANYKALIVSKEIDCSLEDAAVVSLGNLLDAFGLSHLDKMAWLKKVVTWRAKVGPAYRERRHQLRSFVSDLRQAASDSPNKGYLSQLRLFREAMSPLAATLFSLSKSGTLTRPLHDVYASICHLHCNRMIGIDIQAERRCLGLLLRTLEGLEESPHKAGVV